MCRPSRKNRKSITTWQDEVVLKELRDISRETDIKQKQQDLIAEGLTYVLTKYRKRG
jgi:galactose-1-phosphate uridylyltransferase